MVEVCTNSQIRGQAYSLAFFLVFFFNFFNFLEPSYTVCLIFIKIGSDHLQSILTKSYGIQVNSSNRSRITDKRNLQKACKNGSEGVSLQRFGILRPNLVFVITSMT